MPRSVIARTVRRSVALPRALIERADGSAPRGVRGNFNRLVAVALEEYATTRREREFAAAMEQMASDKAVNGESRRITAEFSAADRDGLP